MKAVKIETGVPAPSSIIDLPFKDMKIGESFLVTDESIPKRSVQATASQLGRASGKRFKTKTTEEGIRVWRLK